MNFKNISLFSLLFAASFVGVIARAESEVKMDDLQRKLEFKKQELEAYNGLYAVYSSNWLDFKDACSEELPEGEVSVETGKSSVEACAYASEILKTHNKTYAKIKQLRKEIEKIENEIFNEATK